MIEKNILQFLLDELSWIKNVEVKNKYNCLFTKECVKLILPQYTHFVSVFLAILGQGLRRSYKKWVYTGIN